MIKYAVLWFVLFNIFLWGNSVAEQDFIFFPGESSFGVVAHTMHNAEKLKALNINWVRTNLRWIEQEKEKGKYGFETECPAFEEYWDRGIGLVCILTMENRNPLYPENKTTTQSTIDAISDFCAAYVKHVKTHHPGKRAVFEIGNEPEVFPMGGWWNRPELYTQMARSAARTMKKVDQDCLIAACSVAWFDKSFLQRCFKEGLLSDGTIDLVSFHGYHRGQMYAEYNLKEDIAWLRNEIKKYAPPGKTIDVVDTERGYALVPFLTPKPWHSWSSQAYFRSEQAAYLARHYLTEIAAGIEIIVWYKDMRGETGFSLYEDDRKITPMGHVFRNLGFLFDRNPKEMKNNQYGVTLEDPAGDNEGDPNVTCRVESFVRSEKGGFSLIIAGWHPIEVFDGLILESRKRIGEDFYEAWRAVSPSDPVAISTAFLVEGLKHKPKSVDSLDLNSESPEPVLTEIPFQFDKGQLRIPDIKLQPMPTIVIVSFGEDVRMKGKEV